MEQHRNNPPSTESQDLSSADFTARGDFDKIEYKWKLFEARYAYAWAYFDFHATQRTTVFNFFLVFVGLLVNAYVELFKESPHFHLLATGLAFMGTIITVLFIFLDRRNEELVHIAEDVLESLESDVLFTDYSRTILWPRRRGLLGPMKAAPKQRPLGILLRQTQDEKASGAGKSIYTHGTWIPVLQYFITVAFLSLAILPWVYKCLP